MRSDDEVEDLGTEEEEDGRSDCCSLLSLLLFPFLTLARILLTLCHSRIGAFLHVPDPVQLRENLNMQIMKYG